MMEVKHCRAQHEVLLTFIRDKLHSWGPCDQLPLSYWIDRAVNIPVDPANHPSPLQVTPELKLVMTRATILSEECCRPLSPLEAALRHVDRSQAFTDILKEIQWCVSVLSHASLCRNVESTSSPALREFPWDVNVWRVGHVLLKNAEQEDRRGLMLELQDWQRHHECSAEECGNSHGHRDPRFCLASQFLKKWSEQGSSSDNSDHLSMLLSFDEEVVNLGRLLGSGSFGAVAEASWLGKKYAQKIFNPFGLTSLQAEAEALAKLNNPHIVRVYACSEKSLLLDLLSSDLHKYMRTRMQGGARHQPFSLRAALDLMLQIAEAVRYLHSQGMAHRGLKSSNILVDPVIASGTDLDDEDGFVFAKVADFGLAKVKHELTRFSHLTLNVGTKRWMAPEIFGAHKDDDHLEHAYPMKADVYSFGIVCFEILTGEEPYSDVPFRSLYSMLTSTPPLRPQLPSSCPTALGSLICSCWGADPRERPRLRDVCRVLKYLKGVYMMQYSGDSRWNPTDGVWPFERLPALVKVEGPFTGISTVDKQPTQGPVHITGVNLFFTNSTRFTKVQRFTVSYFEDGFPCERLIGSIGDFSSYKIPLQIKFDYPSEYLVQVEYSYEELDVTSLSFITTERTWGPYGKVSILTKRIPTSPQEIVGFEYVHGELQVHVLQDEERLTQMQITSPGYNRPQQILSAQQPRAFNLNEEREYPSNQVTARIRLSHRQYTSAGLISKLRRRCDWDVTVLNAVEISVTGYPTRTRDGQREFLRKVQNITGDRYAELC